MRKLFYILTLVLVWVSVGCQKEDNTPSEAPKVTSLKELNAAPEFNWATSALCIIKITGLPTIEPVNNTLIIKDNSGNVYYSGFHAMSENLSLNLVIPKTVNELNISFGAFVQKAPLTNGKVDFSFIPVITE